MSTDYSALLSVKSRRELASLLGLEEDELCFYAFSGKLFYNSFNIPKRGCAGTRTIDVPHKNLRDIQRLLAEEFTKLYTATDAAYGFVRGRSIADNALLHIRKQWVARIDLKDFFPSISAARIHGLFQSKLFGLSKEVVDALTNLVCYRGCLPQGAPTSPILSNIICFKMDNNLSALARKNALKYTRYADDLVFSSTKKSSARSIIVVGKNGDPAVSDEVERIISKSGFAVNHRKTGLFSKGTRQVVTGIVVNEKCNFRRDEYRYLRGLFHYWERCGNEELAARYYVRPDSHRKYESRLFTSVGDYITGSLPVHIRGVLDFYAMIHEVNGKHSEPLQRLWTSFHDVTGENVPEMIPGRSVLRTDVYIDLPESSKEKLSRDLGAGSAFVLKGVGLLTACHCLRDINHSFSTYSEYNLTIEQRVNKREIVEMQDYRDFTFSVADDWAYGSVPSEFEKAPGLPLALKRPSLQRGERVIAYGHADGGELRRIEAHVTEILGNEIVVDRAFIKGMSGGPVLNVRGEAIGLVTQGSGKNSYDRDGRFLLLCAIPAVKLLMFSERK